MSPVPPYNYGQLHSWLMFKVFAPRVMELQASLAKDSVPFAAPLDYNTYKDKNSFLVKFRECSKSCDTGHHTKEKYK